jgi:hypothetical protein
MHIKREEVVTMTKDNNMVKKIIGIECPADIVADRVIEVLEEYNLDGQYQITSRVDEDYDETRLKYYRAFSEIGDNPDLVMVVKEGMDGYVAKIVDAYTEEVTESYK